MASCCSSEQREGQWLHQLKGKFDSFLWGTLTEIKRKQSASRNGSGEGRPLLPMTAWNINGTHSWKFCSGGPGHEMVLCSMSKCISIFVGSVLAEFQYQSTFSEYNYSCGSRGACAATPPPSPPHPVRGKEGRKREIQKGGGEKK